MTTSTSIFQKVFFAAAILPISACGGGGSGNDSISSNYELKPGSVGIGSPIATGSVDGDGENQNQEQESNGEQQQIIVANQGQGQQNQGQGQQNQDQGQQNQGQGQQNQDQGQQNQGQGQQNQDQGQQNQGQGQQNQDQGQQNQDQGQQNQGQGQQNQDQGQQNQGQGQQQNQQGQQKQAASSDGTGSLDTHFISRTTDPNYGTNNYRDVGFFRGYLSIVERNIPTDPRRIDNCLDGSYNAVNCAGQQNEHSSTISLGSGNNANYTLHNLSYEKANPDNLYHGTDRDLRIDVLERNPAYNYKSSGRTFNFRTVEWKSDQITVTYAKENGFHGHYSNNRGSLSRSAGLFQADFKLDLRYVGSTKAAYFSGLIGDSDGINIGGVNIGQIRFSGTLLPSGGFKSNAVSFTEDEIASDQSRSSVEGGFKTDKSSVAGELVMKRFFDTSPRLDDDWGQFETNLNNRGDNAIVGAFAANKTGEELSFIRAREPRTQEGSLSVFEYGLWNNDYHKDNRTYLSIPRESIVYPLTPVKSVDVGGSFENVRDSITLTYKKKDGFHGLYTYEDVTGKFKSDVHLRAVYSSTAQGHGTVTINGIISEPFTMNADNFNGIIIHQVILDPNTGSLAANGNPKVSFGTIEFDPSSDVISPQIQDIHTPGTFDLNMGITGGKNDAVKLKNYPRHVGGEFQIKDFSTDGVDYAADNSIVGVFVGDRESGRNYSSNEDIE